MVDEIVRAVGKDLIHAVIVTGDLTFRARAAEFDRLVQDLGDLLVDLHLAPDKLLLIPGNHDADWSKEPEDRLGAYRAAFQRLRGREVDDFCHDELLAEGTAGERVRFVGVNSCQIESEEHAGMGAVGAELLTELLNDRSSPGPLTTTVLCLHHHLLPVSYEEREYESRKKSSVTLDAKAVLEIAQRNGIEIILHGHQHQPNLAVYGSLNPLQPRDDQGSLIWLVGAGSAGAVDADLGQAKTRHFQVLTFEDKGSHVHCRVQAYVSHSVNNQEFTAAGEPISIHLGIGLPSGPPPHLKVEEKVLRAIRGAGRQSAADDSDLFIVLIKTRFCAQVNEWLRHLQADGIRVDAIYDLYGDFDLLVKVRTKDASLINKRIVTPLREDRLVSAKWGRTIDVFRERYPTSFAPMPVDEASHSIKAFMYFSLIDDGDPIAEICGEIASSLGTRTVMSSAYLSNGGTELMVEYLVACGAYYELSAIVTAIEGHMQAGQGQKVTLLAQRVWEQPMLRAVQINPSLKDRHA